MRGLVANAKATRPLGLFQEAKRQQELGILVFLERLERRCDILPGAFTYDNLIAYLQGYVDYFDCDRWADKELKPSKDIWDGTATEWIWEKLYEFALENPRDDPERVLHEWYQKMFKNYKLADGSEKMRGVYFEAIRIIDTIREELWEGYRE